MSQHTPHHIVEADLNAIVTQVHTNLPAILVKRYNSHDALVMVSRLVADTYEAEQVRGNFPAGQTWWTIDHATGQAARAALALAAR